MLPEERKSSMISYVILGITFLYAVIQISIYVSRKRKPLGRDDIDERLLAALNGGDTARE
jgi:hypothetical protein